MSATAASFIPSLIHPNPTSAGPVISSPEIAALRVEAVLRHLPLPCQANTGYLKPQQPAKASL